MASRVGKKSSVGELLSYKYNLEIALTLPDHDNCKYELFDSVLLFTDPQKSKRMNYYANTMYINDKNDTD